MQRTSLVNLNVFSLVLSLFGLVSAASAPLQKVTFVFSGFHERTSFVFVAKGMRFFEEQESKRRSFRVRKAPAAISAMAANDAQFYTTSATGSALGSIAGVAAERRHLHR